MSSKVYLVRGIIIGFFIGLLFMLPHVIKWMNFPVIYVEFVPDSVYYALGEKRSTIKDIMSKEIPKPSVMEVVITDAATVQQACNDLAGYDVEGCDLAQGFHYYDREKKKHWIYSIDSTVVLTHEFRHIFEGTYHRTKRDIINARICKKLNKKYTTK